MKTSSRISTFWREFPTKKAAIETIQGIIDPQPFKIPFESSLISDLILERHYFCSLHHLRPSRFRKVPGFRGYKFEGDFSGLSTPEPIGWHGVSWRKCVDKPRTEWKDYIVRAMRDRIEPEKSRYREEHPICEDCQQLASVDVHHAKPSFLSLTDSIRMSVSDLEVSGCLSGWNWFLPDNFILPEGHRITILFDQLHRTAILQALCRECHKKAGEPENLGRAPLF